MLNDFMDSRGKTLAALALLLKEANEHVLTAQKDAAMSQRAETFTPIESLAQRVKMERKRQGLSLQSLSNLSGVAYATLCNIERGNEGTQMDKLSSVLKALGLSLWVG